MKLKQGMLLHCQLGPAFRKQAVVFDIALCIEILVSDKQMMSKSALKRLIKQGGVEIGLITIDNTNK